jgi:hypothetical protein
MQLTTQFVEADVTSAGELDYVARPFRPFLQLFIQSGREITNFEDVNSQKSGTSIVIDIQPIAIQTGRYVMRAPHASSVVNQQAESNLTQIASNPGITTLLEVNEI